MYAFIPKIRKNTVKKNSHRKNVTLKKRNKSTDTNLAYKMPASYPKSGGKSPAS